MAWPSVVISTTDDATLRGSVDVASGAAIGTSSGSVGAASGAGNAAPSAGSVTHCVGTNGMTPDGVSGATSGVAADATAIGSGVVGANSRRQYKQTSEIVKGNISYL